MFLVETLAALFTVATTLFVAKIVNPGEVEGGYFAFVVVGLMVGVFLSAGLVTVSRNLRNEQERGTLEALLSIGVAPSRLSTGMTAYPVLSAVPTASVFLLLAVVLGMRVPSANWLLACFALVLGAFSFAGLGLIGAALVVVFRRGEALIGWLLVGLTFAAGELFPRDLLPSWLEFLGSFSPFTISLQLTRDALLGEPSGSHAIVQLLILLLMGVGFWILGIWSLTTALHVAKRRGTLSQY
jgi:ABC-2 type transport system permease protein